MVKALIVAAMVALYEQIEEIVFVVSTVTYAVMHSGLLIVLFLIVTYSCGGEHGH